MKLRYLNTSRNQCKRQQLVADSTIESISSLAHYARRLRALIALIAIFVAMVVPSATADASVGGEIIKAVGRYIMKETGQEASEQAIKQMTKQVGEALIERTAQKVVREGGEKSLVELSELVAKHGPEVIRALDNAPDALPLLRLLDDLPVGEVGKAASRLAAGSTGRELATISTKLGTSVLRAEAKHPGIGLKFAKALGNEGTQLSLKLTTDQAVQIGRHADDIAKLPKIQQQQLLTLISENTNRLCSFVGRFVEQNPGKVLFTAASTTIVLSNSSAIIGDGEIVLGPDGQALLDKNGMPIRHHPSVWKEPVSRTLLWCGGVVVVLISLAGASKVWKWRQNDKIDLEEAKQASLQRMRKSAKNQ